MPAEKLAYQNRFVKQLVQELQGYEASLATPQVISGPDNTIILQVSYDEWKKILSSVFTGADFCYPEESDTVRWSLLRAVEQPVSICAKIIECIETDSDVQDALNEFLLNSDVLKELIEAQGNIGKPINPEIVVLQNDDLDRLFGSITFLVDTMHDAIVDFNQDAEAANNSRELGQIIFGAIPIIETLPFNEVSEYADTLFEQIIEVFDSQWDTTPITGTRDRIRCALFCIARANGNALTWELIQDYFYSLTGFTWSQTLNIMLEFANFLATGTWTGEEVVDIAFGNMAAAMAGMGKFGEMLFPTLTSIMRLGQNNPDSDWEIVCETCPTFWCFSIDLKSTNGSIYGVQIGAPEFPYSLYVSGVGVRSTDPDDRVWFGEVFPDPIDLDEVTIEWEYVPGEEFSPSNVWIGYNGSEGSPTGITAEQTSFTRSGLTGVEDLIFILERSGSNETRLANITRITLKGTGDIPPIFGTSNC